MLPARRGWFKLRVLNVMQEGFSVMSTALSQSVDSALRDYITFWATRDWINFSPEDGTLICPVFFWISLSLSNKCVEKQLRQMHFPTWNYLQWEDYASVTSRCQYFCWSLELLANPFEWSHHRKLFPNSIQNYHFSVFTYVRLLKHWKGWGSGQHL